ncbi:MAG: flagellar hook-associated protein FlgL [Burkholderiaceae bacterium]
MTRTSTATAFDRAIQSMNSQQARLQQLQAQIATGRKAGRAADDPVAAAQSESVRGEITRIDVERRMVGFARTILQQADTALATGTDIVNTARDLVLQANNSTLTPADRASIASQIGGLRAELLSVANTRDGAGAFVFGGQGSRTAPFVETAGVVGYTADPGNQQTGQDTRVSTSLDGHATFMSVPDGAGGRQSIFDVLDAAIAVLSDPDATTADIGAAAQAAIDGLDSGLGSMSLARTNVGAQLRMIDQVEGSLDNSELDAQTRLSAIVDVDFAAAISEFAKVHTGLQAAMQTYSKLSSTSLFNYLR